jgi:hypothetical protein
MRELLGVIKRGQFIEAFVGNLGDSNVSLARICERLLGEMQLGKNSKKRCLAYLRQANSASFPEEFSVVSYRLSVESNPDNSE